MGRIKKLRRSAQASDWIWNYYRCVLKSVNLKEVGAPNAESIQILATIYSMKVAFRYTSNHPTACYCEPREGLDWTMLSKPSLQVDTEL